MITSKAKIDFNAMAIDVELDDHMLRVRLANGREITAPLECFPSLRDATPEQRTRWELLGGGHGIHWQDPDEDISVRGLMRLN